MRESVVGMGIIANPVRRVSNSYIGTLLSNGTIFDKKTADSEGVRGRVSNGIPLKFHMGTGEVIKGLERGL